MNMGRKLDQIISSLPKARREAIEKRASMISEAMVQASLQELRQAAEKTQAQIAASMGLAQNAVSQLEGRSDLRLSTLKRYVDAVGGTVMVVVELKGGRRFQIRQGASDLAMSPQGASAVTKRGMNRKLPARRAK
jgi:hypothetical protein